MNPKKLFVILFSIFFVFTSYIYVQFISHIQAFNLDKRVSLSSVTNPANPLPNKKILVINTQPGFGGGEIYTLSLYRNLLRLGFDAKILICKRSWLENELIRLDLPYFAARSFYFKFKDELIKLCKKEKFDLIHCNVAREVNAAKEAATKLPIKVVFTKHILNAYDPSITSNLDGLIVVSSLIKNEMKEKNKSQDLNIKKITMITPFFEEDRFVNFKTNEIKNEFFFKNYSLTLKNLPVVTCVANMTRDKNPFLLVKALAICVHEKHKPFEAIFAGSGRQLNRVKSLASELKVSEYVHFLGHTRRIPAIINFSDIVVNTSINEGFGMSILEACFMKKPIIVTSGTGTSDMVTDQKNGFVVQNNNEKELAIAIEKLMDSPDLRLKFGLASYENVKSKFSIAHVLSKLEKFYKKVLFTKSSVSEEV